MEINGKIFFIFAIIFLILGVNLVVSQESSETIDSADVEYVDQLFAGRETLKVDVYLNEELSKRQFNRVVKTIDSSKIVKEYYPEGFIAEVSKQEALSLLSNDNVVLVDESLEVRPFLQDAVNIVGATGAWNLEYNGENLDGTGKAVCIVDTGVDTSHPDLAGKILGGGNFDCTQSSTCPLNASTSDYDGHGTHVAGIAAAAGGINGIAKGANIVSVKVFTDAGDTDEFLIRRGIKQCTALASQYDIAATSISIGSIELYNGHCDNISSIISNEINNATTLGIAVVVATGNDGNSTAIALPSCMQNAIPVAASEKDDDPWANSNYNSLVKLFAPGVGINSTRSQHEGPGDYAIKSGTSMSTPMVSGSIAMLQQLLELRGEEMNPKTEIEPLLFDTGESIGTLEFNSWRRINIFNALSTFDLTSVGISFVPPTPANGSSQSSTTLKVNVSMTSSGDKYSFINFDNDLFLWHRMDDRNGSTIVDLSGVNNNGVLSGNAFVNAANGRFGEGAHFDGLNDAADDFIKVASLKNSPRFRNSFSVSMWVKNDENLTSGFNDMTGTESASNSATKPGWAIKINNQEKVQFTLSNGTAAKTASAKANTPLTPGTWHHVVVVYDSNVRTMRVYVDAIAGGNMATGVPSNGGVVNKDVFTGKASSAARIWNGSIDEVLFFNRALKIEDVRALRDSSSNKYYREFTGLNTGQHRFRAHVVDINANRAATEERFVTIM